jgi:murein lipoprotein
MKGRIQHPGRKLALAVIVGAFVGLTGCASTGQLQELEDRLKGDIAAAKADAAAASAKANEALGVANEANRRSMDTESKIDRMFKKAMHK